MPLSRTEKLKRRSIAARLRRKTERLAKQAAAAEHAPTDQVPERTAVSHKAARLPYKPGELLTDEERARGVAEGRFTAYGDLWTGPLPVPRI